MTTTIVMHDAHVCARDAFVITCAVAAQAVATAKARCARKAARAAMRVAKRAAVKAANAVKVARKEAAEQYASRCATRIAAKAAAAPAVRAAKLQAAAVAKAVKAANAVRLDAVRAQRAAASAAKTITTTVVAIDKAYVQHTMAARATVVCVGTPMHSAHVHAYHATIKAANKAANKVHAAIKAPRCTLNSPEKRASITMACNAVRAAVHAAQAKTGTSISNTKVQARLAQGAAQRAANAARKAATPAKVARPQVVIVRSGPVKNNGAKRVKAPRVHTVESALAQVAKKQAIIKAKEDAAIAKAKKWALRKEAYANRKAAMEVIASDAWMNAGVWLSEDLIRGANDWSYQVRIAAFKEARAIAYPPKTKAVATTGVAA